jgi:hypothetical protein
MVKRLLWLQYPSKINSDNLNNIRNDASRHFRNKKREYLKDKINELAMNSKNNNIRDLYIGINESEGVTKLLADSHNILNRWKNHFSQLLMSFCPFEVETALANFLSYKWPGSDQIPAELIQPGGETSQSEIHKLINSV